MDFWWMMCRGGGGLSEHPLRLNFGMGDFVKIFQSCIWDISWGKKTSCKYLRLFLITRITNYLGSSCFSLGMVRCIKKGLRGETVCTLNGWHPKPMVANTECCVHDKSERKRVGCINGEKDERRNGISFLTPINDMVWICFGEIEFQSALCGNLTLAP